MTHFTFAQELGMKCKVFGRATPITHRNYIGTVHLLTFFMVTELVLVLVVYIVYLYTYCHSFALVKFSFFVIINDGSPKY